MRNLLMFLLSLSLFSCAKDKSDSEDLTSFLPRDAAVIFKLQNPTLFFSHLTNNDFIKTNTNHPLRANLQQQLSFLDLFPHKSPAYLSFSTEKNGRISYTFIHESLPDTLNLDSIRNKTVETLSADYGQIKKYTLENQITYTSSIDSIFLVSDSRRSLEAILRNRGKEEFSNVGDFEKSLKASASDKPVVLINHRNFSGIIRELLPFLKEEKFSDFSNWTSLDIEMAPTGILLNGITTAGDTLPKLINVFKGVNPTANELQQLAPSDSRGFFSFTFENFTILQRNLARLSANSSHVENSVESELLENSSEAGMLYFEGAPVFAIKSQDIETSKSDFSSSGEFLEEFHGIPVFSYPGENAFEFLGPLLSLKDLKYFLFLDRFILFSSDLDKLKNVVTAFQNDNTLGKSEAYLHSFQSLSTEASLLWVSNNREFKKHLDDFVPKEVKEATGELNFSGFPIAALQFIYQSDFAHVHAVLQRSEAQIEGKDLQQQASVTLDSRLLAPPIFFKNHRSNGLDMAVQDVNNTLYLISATGKIHWKKKIDGPVLGKIQQVDLYRNGRIQLAFATPHALHVIDRDGNLVKPFPLEFRDEITQPLAVFDYDNNRKYRFLVVQNRDVYMYDSRGKSVRGFKFHRASDEITQPPKHIRIGKKDYILVPEASGKLNILSRTGTSRVKARENFKPSGNEWYEYDNNFVTTNEEGELVKVDQDGMVSREALGLSENHGLVATAKTLVTFSDNQLRIKGKTVSLDFGLYSEPQIFFLNNKIYVSVTDTQAHRVYLFDSNAELISDFPVYGNSSIDLGNADGDPNLELTVMGDEDSVLLYEFGS